MNEGWNVEIRYDETFAGLNIWFIHKNGERITTVSPINLEMRLDINPHEITPEPTLRMTSISAKQFLQGLSEALSRTGFIPDSIKASDKEVDAIKYHLEDMRKIVFDKPE